MHRSIMAGNATGERLSARKVQAIIAAAVVEETVQAVANLAKVNWKSAKLVMDRESQPIAERERALEPIFARIAERGALRIERDIDSAPFTAAVVATGVATDKLIALSSDPTQNVQQHLHLHLQHNDVTANFNSLLERLESKALALPRVQPGTHPECPEALLDPDDNQPIDVVTQSACNDDHARAEKAESESSVEPAGPTSHDVTT